MIAAVVLTVYGLGWLFAARKVYQAARREDLRSGVKWDGISTGMNAALGLCTGLLWPLILPAAIVVWNPPKTPEELKAQAREHGREIEKLRARNARLERELGIGGH